MEMVKANAAQRKIGISMDATMPHDRLPTTHCLGTWDMERGEQVTCTALACRAEASLQRCPDCIEKLRGMRARLAQALFFSLKPQRRRRRSGSGLWWHSIGRCATRSALA